MDRISICEALIKRNEIDPFLKRMVTGDEKWVTYDNIVRKRSWSKRGKAAQTVAKPGLTARKVLLCIWRDFKGIIHYELLPSGQTLNSNQYCEQLTVKLRELGWEVSMHPPYSPDLAPSDYHLFLALQNFLSDKKLGSREDYENRLLEFFANKDQGFYERGIMKLPLKWQQIVAKNGAYLTQIGQSEASWIESRISRKNNGFLFPQPIIFIINQISIAYNKIIIQCIFDAKLYFEKVFYN